MYISLIYVYRYILYNGSKYLYGITLSTSQYYSE